MHVQTRANQGLPLRTGAPGSLRLPSALRLRPPSLPALCVDRPALLAHLNEASQYKVSVLTAPAGSGKTTVLTQWVTQCLTQQGRGRRVAWLSLDESDANPAQFCHDLVAAVQSVTAAFEVPESVRHAAVLGEHLARLTQPLMIVLDDIQWLAAPALGRVLDSLLQHTPAQVQWILSGRRMPALNLGPLRLSDQLRVLTAADLNADRELVQQLAGLLGPRPLSELEADTVLARTQGWLAGIKFALLAIADADDVTLELQTFSGSHEAVAHYFEAHVLQDQSKELREFLVASSTVDKMTSELCNALLGIGHSQRLLEQLERSQLFTQALDKHAHWYRYHPLLLDFLRSGLRHDAARLPVLHERASRWWAEHQFFAEALAHAFLGGSYDWRRELVARCACAWLRSGEIAAVIHWCERLPRAEVMMHRDMGVAYVSSLILSRRFDAAAQALHDMEVCASVVEPVRPGPLRLLHLMLGVLSDREGAQDLAVEDLLQHDGADGFLAGILLTLQAYAALRQSRLAQAWRLAMRARDALEPVSAYGFGYASVVASLVERAQGDVKSAATRCEQIFATVQAGPRSPAWVNAATALAHVRYEANRLTEAEALCTELLPWLSMASTVENFAITYIMLARLKAIQATPLEALRLLDYLHSVLESGGHRRFLVQVCGEKVRLWLAQHNLPQALAVAAEFGVPQAAAEGAWDVVRPHDETWERLGLAQAWLWMHQQAYAPAQALLCVLRDSAQAAGHAYRGMAVEAALATCHWGAGEVDAAFLALGRAFVWSRGYGFPRSVFDETPGLVPLIAAALKQRMLHHLLPSGYLHKFESLLGARPAAGVGLPASTGVKRRVGLPLEPLTEREIDMLRLLAQGLSNQEISTRSKIALSTAKWHLKNVFAKLDVSTRTGALARARDLQLIA